MINVPQKKKIHLILPTFALNQEQDRIVLNFYAIQNTNQTKNIIYIV